MNGGRTPREQLGNYGLLERLSESFFGPRWAAARTDDDDGPLLAVRCVNSRLLSDTETIDRLAKAAWWAMEVDHPHAPGVTDVVAEEGRLGVVSAFHEGDTLRLLLRRAHRERKAIPIPVALQVMLDILDAMKGIAGAAANEDDDIAAYVHGGVTPDSVHVGTDGQIRLLDVGVAAMASGDPSWSDDPARAAYDPPERASGAALDARSDIFMFGVLLYEMLTCEHLFTGTSAAEVARKVRELPIPKLAGRSRWNEEPVPTALEDVVMRALARVPEGRFEDYAAMEQALRALALRLASREDIGDFVRELGGRTTKQRRMRLGTTQAPPEAAAGAPQPKPGASPMPLAGAEPIDPSAHEATTARPPAPEPEPDDRTTRPVPAEMVAAVRATAADASHHDRPTAPVDPPTPVEDAASATPAGLSPLQAAVEAKLAETATKEATPSPTPGAEPEPGHEQAANDLPDLVAEVVEEALDLIAESVPPPADARPPAPPPGATGEAAPRPGPVAIAPPPPAAIAPPPPSAKVAPPPPAAKRAIAPPPAAEAAPAPVPPPAAFPQVPTPTARDEADTGDEAPEVDVDASFEDDDAPASENAEPAAAPVPLAMDAENVLEDEDDDEVAPVAAKADTSATAATADSLDGPVGPGLAPASASLGETDLTLGDLPPTPRRSGRKVALGGGLLLLVAAAAVAFLLSRGHEEPPSQTAASGQATPVEGTKVAAPAESPTEPAPAPAEVEPVEPAVEEEAIEDEATEDVEATAGATDEQPKRKWWPKKKEEPEEPTTFIPDDI